MVLENHGYMEDCGQYRIVTRLSIEICTALEQPGHPAQLNIVEPDVVTWMTSFSISWVIRASRDM